jgi:hypothetical protein
MRFPLPTPPPAVAVIVPMKGAGLQAAQCLASIMAQDYPAYRVIIGVEAANDPAYAFARSLSDDVPLSRAMRGAALDVTLMPNLVVASPCDFTLAAALNFVRRQYAMLRLYSPGHWLFSLAVYAVFFAGFGASIAALLLPVPAYALWMAGAAWALLLARGLAHAAIAARVLPKHIAGRLRAASVLDTLLPFLPALLHAYGLLASVRVRKLRWAGIGYTLAGNRVERVER